MNLRALPDDWKLNANGDTRSDSALSVLTAYNMVDSSGNNMVDSSGNFLVGLAYVSMYTTQLHALPDDHSLRAE